MRKCGYLFLSLTLACSTPKSDQQSFSTAQRDSLFQNDVASSKEELTGTGLEKSLQEQGLVNIQKEISGIQVELKFSNRTCMVILRSATYSLLLLRC
jgi:zinc D-Ala-D-Ala dipeptidase